MLVSALAGWTQPPVISASAAVLMDAATGTVLFDQAMQARRPMASTTKIMTALVALESADLRDPVVIGADALRVESPGLDLEVGETIALADLLTALMLKSSNAAAIAIADHIAGSVPAFAQRMNDRARALGARDTHFVNPHGLAEPDHYSSAYDLALIAREALRNPWFGKLVAQRTGTIARPSLGITESFDNHNRLLWQADYVDGVKTGYVRESGQCLVASGTRDGWRLIAVVLDSPDHYREALRLLDYGFAAFRRQVHARPGDAVGRARVSCGRLPFVPAVCQRELSQVVGPGLPGPARLGVSLKQVKAPVRQGEVVGQASLLVGDRAIATSPLVASRSVPRSRLVAAVGWTLPLGGGLAATLVGIRASAKLVRSRRRRRRGLAAQGRGFDPRGPGAG
jgi:D-alanyl-D-alanine carboxypeptidase (penicillin-binding protein 5/6)